MSKATKRRSGFWIRPGPGPPREAWLWTFLAPGAKAVVFDFQLTRSHKPALAFLRDFRGAFQTDGYAAYGKALTKIGKYRTGESMEVRSVGVLIHSSSNAPGFALVMRAKSPAASPWRS